MMRIGKIKSLADLRDLLFVLVSCGLCVLCLQVEGLISELLQGAFELLCLWELYDLFRPARKADS